MKLRLIDHEVGFKCLDENNTEIDTFYVDENAKETFRRRYEFMLLRFYEFQKLIDALNIEEQIRKNCISRVLSMAGTASHPPANNKWIQWTKDDRKLTKEFHSNLLGFIQTLNWKFDEAGFGKKYTLFAHPALNLAVNKEPRPRIIETHLIDEALCERIKMAQEILTELKKHIETRAFKALHILERKGQPKGEKIKSQNKKYLAKCLWSELKNSKGFRPTKYRAGPFAKLLASAIDAIWNERIAQPMSLMKDLD